MHRGNGFRVGISLGVKLVDHLQEERGHLGILRGVGAEADWCACVCARAREEGGGGVEADARIEATPPSDLRPPQGAG